MKKSVASKFDGIQLTISQITPEFVCPGHTLDSTAALWAGYLNVLLTQPPVTDGTAGAIDSDRKELRTTIEERSENRKWTVAHERSLKISIWSKSS